MQVPSEVGIAHDVQFAVQVVAQQTLCAQWPELHMASAVHVEPVERRPQLFVVVLQVFGDAQSVVAPHIVLQTFAVVSHAYGVQSDELTVLQTPVPSQVRDGVKVEPAQLCAAQTVPEAYRRHLPLPSQLPSVPQVAAVASAHAARGSVPAAMLVQVPRVPVSAHEAQVPEQVEAQQTPCWQRPEAQVPAAVQV
jgi:hypothetical protein